MAFPLWINSSLRFNIDDIGVSSEKYLINHIEQRLNDIGLKIWSKKDDKLVYYKGSFLFLWRRIDFIDNGLIKIEVTKTEVVIKLKSLTAGMFFGSLLFGSLLLMDDITEPRWRGAMFLFCFSFGFGFITRYFTQRNLKKEIKNMILSL